MLIPFGRKYILNPNQVGGKILSVKLRPHAKPLLQAEERTEEPTFFCSGLIMQRTNFSGFLFRFLHLYWSHNHC